MGLYISVATASSENMDSPLNNAITLLASIVARKNIDRQIPNSPSIDITFMLPGKHEKPDFSGMRMGGYTNEGDTLFFEKAIPEHLLNSSHAKHYISMVMDDVVTNADMFFKEHQIEFDTQSWKQIVDQLALMDKEQHTLQ